MRGASVEVGGGIASTAGMVAIVAIVVVIVAEGLDRGGLRRVLGQHKDWSLSLHGFCSGNWSGG